MAEDRVTIRPIRKEDAPLMLEWMHDPSISGFFQRDMMNTTREEVENFCIKAEEAFRDENEAENLHWAVVSENGEYMGTISLKNIDRVNENAEYAIAMRSCARGRGYGKTATMELLHKAFCQYGLHRVYLTVVENNDRAIAMYEKCGFAYEGSLRDHLLINGEYIGWRLYGILKSEFDVSKCDNGYTH